MKKVIILALFILGCGDKTSIQTGEVGKQLTASGLEDDIRAPGSFRMDVCWSTACPKLVRLQVNKSTADLKIDSLFLPKSNVDIKNVQVGLQFQVKNNKESINKIFEEVRPTTSEGQVGESDRVLLITADMVYETYLKRKAPDAIISALREHTVEQVLTNVPEIAGHTKEMINEMLSETPVEVTELGFPNGIGEVPEQVIDSKRKLFAIEEEKARRIKNLEADLVIESQRQAVQKKRVSNDIENSILSGISYEKYVQLKTFERFADAAEQGTQISIGSFQFMKE